MPPSVSYARELLYGQASIWLLLGGWLVLHAHEFQTWMNPALALGAAGISGALAGAKAWLGLRIPRGSDRTRQGVIVVEWVMACLGAVLTLVALGLEDGGMPALACLVGGGLSLRAAMGLTKPPARQYFVGPSGEVVQTNPTSGPDDGSAPFRRLVRVNLAHSLSVKFLQPPEMGAGGADGITRQRRTHPVISLPCYARS